MSENDEVDELFGDDDDVVVSTDKFAAEEEEAPVKRVSKVTKSNVDEADELFGDDDDDVENGTADGHDDKIDDDDDGKLSRIDYAQNGPVSIVIPRVEKYDGTAELSQVVLASVLAYDPTEFKEANFLAHAEAFQATLAPARAAVTKGYRNVIRYETGADGQVHSNARLIEWADGSKQIQVGDEYFNLNSSDLTMRDPQFLAVENSHVYQSLGLFTKKSTCAMGTTKSKSQAILKKIVDEFTKQETQRGTHISDELSDLSALLEKSRKMNKELAQKERSANARKGRDEIDYQGMMVESGYIDDDEVDEFTDDEEETPKNKKRKSGY